MQDAVIGMGIIVVALALWRLQSRPRQFGAFGAWAATNIFGAATLSLLPGPGQDGGPVGAPVAASSGSSSSTNAVPVANSNEFAPGSSQGAALTNPPNTNPAVTLIADTDQPDSPLAVRPATNMPDAATLERRLGEASAKGGDLQFSLFWKNYNDLDLHCVDPAGEEIFFNNKKSSRTAGELDVDQNAHEPYRSPAVENIYWPVGAAPPGLYRITVVYYAQHDKVDLTPFAVRTIVQGRTNFFTSTISYTGSHEGKRICTLQYDPANPNPAQRYRFVQR